MAKRTPAKTSRKPLEEADPRFVPVTKAFARTGGFSLMESKTGAMRGLILNGKSFGMSSNGRFILKLDAERVATLMARGIGRPFAPSTGRLMKDWVEVTHPDADWVALAREAYRLAAASRPPTRRTKR
jgi:hypothetical protein